MFTISHRLVDIRAAAKLEAEEQIHRIVAFLRQVHDIRIEGHNPRGDAGHAGQDAADDGGIDYRLPHGTALVNVQYHVPFVGRGGTGAVKEIEMFRHNGLQLLIVMFQVPGNGRLVVKSHCRGNRGMPALVDGSRHRPADVLFQQLVDLLHDFPDENPHAFLGALRNLILEKQDC